MRSWPNGRSAIAGGCAAAAVFAYMFAVPHETAAESVQPAITKRSAASHEVSAKFLWLYEPPLRWIRPPVFYYNPVGAPVGSPGRFVAAIKSAIDQWRDACGIDIVYGGETDLRVPPAFGVVGESDRDGVNVVGWTDIDDVFLSADANLVLDRALDGRDSIAEADVRFFANSYTDWNDREFTYLALHELGHALGLGHSDRSSVVMSGQPHTQYRTVTTLTDDDIAGCRTLYADAPIPAGVEVVEYYRADVDHYFMTWRHDEMAKLDRGHFSGWQRTGKRFRIWLAPGPGRSAMCRVYLPPAIGDSHFYGRSDDECMEVERRDSRYIIESRAFMYGSLPVGGACPAATKPVYRFFNGRADVNHRFVTDSGERARMLAEGWIAEGEGPDAVTHCAP